MTTLADHATIGMSERRAADLRELNAQIEFTAAFLSSLHRERQSLMERADPTPSLFVEPDAVGGDAMEQLRQTNDRLSQFRDEWESQQRRIDDEFDQRLRDQADEPQREFSDCF